MTEVTYTAGGQKGLFTVSEERVVGRMAVEAETRLLASLADKGLTIDEHERTYLRSRITVAITRDIVTKERVDLGEIRVQGGTRPALPPTIPVEKPAPSGDVPLPEPAGAYYTLVHVSGGKVTRRKYGPDQSVGAVIADIRQMYQLKLSEQVIIFQRLNGVQREVSATTLLRNLSDRDFFWDTQSIE